MSTQYKPRIFDHLFLKLRATAPARRGAAVDAMLHAGISPAQVRNRLLALLSVEDFPTCGLQTLADKGFLDLETVKFIFRLILKNTHHTEEHRARALERLIESASHPGLGLASGLVDLISTSLEQFEQPVRLRSDRAAMQSEDWAQIQAYFDARSLPHRHRDAIALSFRLLRLTKSTAALRLLTDILLQSIKSGTSHNLICSDNPYYQPFVEALQDLAQSQRQIVLNDLLTELGRIVEMPPQQATASRVCTLLVNLLADWRPLDPGTIDGLVQMSQRLAQIIQTASASGSRQDQTPPAAAFASVFLRNCNSLDLAPYSRKYVIDCLLSNTVPLASPEFREAVTFVSRLDRALAVHTFLQLLSNLTQSHDPSMREDEAIQRYFVLERNLQNEEIEAMEIPIQYLLQPRLSTVNRSMARLMSSSPAVASCPRCGREFTEEAGLQYCVICNALLSHCGRCARSLWSSTLWWRRYCGAWFGGSDRRVRCPECAGGYGNLPAGYEGEDYPRERYERNVSADRLFPNLETLLTLQPPFDMRNQDRLDYQFDTDGGQLFGNILKDGERVVRSAVVSKVGKAMHVRKPLYYGEPACATGLRWRLDEYHVLRIRTNSTGRYAFDFLILRLESDLYVVKDVNLYSLGHRPE